MSAKKFTTHIAEAEGKELVAVQLSESELQAAVARAPQRAEELETAEDALGDVEASFRQVESDHDTADLVRAEASVRVAKLRLAGAETALQRARQRLRSADTAAAEVAAKPVRDVLEGVEIITTFVTPPIQPDKDHDKFPCVVVTATGIPEHTPFGTVDGTATIRYFRHPTQHTPLDARSLQDAARELGINLQTIGSVTNFAGYDELKVRVNGHVDIPFIAEITPGSHVRFPDYLARELADRMRYHNTAIQGHGTFYETSHVVAIPGRVEVHSDSTDRDGVRTLTLDGAVTIHTKRAIEGLAPSERIGELVERLGREGRLMPKLGVVTGCELIPTSPRIPELSDSDRRDAVSLAAGPVDMGKLPYAAADVSQFIVRATFVSRQSLQAA